MYGGAKVSIRLLKKLLYFQQKLSEPKNATTFGMNLS